MSDVNVRDNVTEEIVVTARERNLARGDQFIKYQLHDADEAYRRLRVVRSVLKNFEKDIEEAGTRSLPEATLELYEKVKINLRDLEILEAETVRTGE